MFSMKRDIVQAMAIDEVLVIAAAFVKAEGMEPATAYARAMHEVCVEALTYIATSAARHAATNPTFRN